MSGKEASKIQYMVTVDRVVHITAVIDVILNATLHALTKMDLKLAAAIVYSVDALPTKRTILTRVLT